MPFEARLEDIRPSISDNWTFSFQRQSIVAVSANLFGIVFVTRISLTVPCSIFHSGSSGHLPLKWHRFQNTPHKSHCQDESWDIYENIFSTPLTVFVFLLLPSFHFSPTLDTTISNNKKIASARCSKAQMRLSPFEETTRYTFNKLKIEKRANIMHFNISLLLPPPLLFFSVVLWCWNNCTQFTWVALISSFNFSVNKQFCYSFETFLTIPFFFSRTWSERRNIKRRN